MCGRCCRVWAVSVDKKTAGRIKSTGLYGEITTLYPDREVFHQAKSTGRLFVGKVDSRCIMLEGNLCRIHRDLSPEMKPDVCRMFPFILVPTPDGVFAGVSFYCPSISENTGDPLEEYRPMAEEILRKMNPVLPDSKEEIPLGKSRYIEWSSYTALEEFILQCLDEADIINGIWKAIDGIGFVLDATGPGKIADVDLIKNLYKMKIPPIIDREKGFFAYQSEYAASLISILEMWSRSMLPENMEKVLRGGVMESDTFGKTIEVKPLGEYLVNQSVRWDDALFRFFMKHLARRKFLLCFNSIFTGMVTMSFFPYFLAWYSNASAVSHGVEKPEKKNIQEALGYIDLYCQHLDILNPLFARFAGGIGGIRTSASK